MSFLSSCPIRSDLLFFATALSKERLNNSPKVTAIERAVSAGVEKKNKTKKKQKKNVKTTRFFSFPVSPKVPSDERRPYLQATIFQAYGSYFPRFKDRPLVTMFFLN